MTTEFVLSDDRVPHHWQGWCGRQHDSQGQESRILISEPQSSGIDLSLSISP